MDEQTKMLRGVAMVRAALGEEDREMQSRVYARVRPYLAGTMRRLRHAYQSFQTVVFDTRTGRFAFVSSDGTQHREAPKAFRGLAEVCEELARFSEIEWLTAADPLWQVMRATPQPAVVIEQYRHIQDADWQFWMRRPLREARYYMRQDIYSRTVHGSHGPGYGKRIVGENGAVVDEWIDPVEEMIRRALRENGKAVALDGLCAAMNKIAGYRNGYYIWDVRRACDGLRQRGYLRRVNPKSSDVDARFSLVKA